MKEFCRAVARVAVKLDINVGIKGRGTIVYIEVPCTADPIHNAKDEPHWFNVKFAVQDEIIGE